MNSYLIIKVEGKIIEKFILRCKKNNINLLKIERISNKEIIIKINSKDYENLNKIKSIYTLTIINNEGYLKFKEELKTWFEDAVKFYGELAEINARYGRM